MSDDWWKFCPACQCCDELEDCDEPCTMAMSMLGVNGQ